MIIRVYRCTVVAGKDAEFREFAFSKSHPWLRERPGLIAFYAGRPLPGSDERTRCMVQIWESLSAIQAALGDDWRQPLKLPAEARAFIESASVEHYELADEFRSSASC
jgi:heme-degrading monooxygenase HmoA